MTVLTLGIGQCGNQVLNTLLNYIYDDIQFDNRDNYSQEAINRWYRFNSKGVLCARSVLVDTENKVIDVFQNGTKFRYPRSIKKPVGGASNNWAHGYHNIGKTIIDEVTQEIRKEIEICDSTPAFLTVQSTSGGTGSGVGSYILERLRDDYPNKAIASCVVLPFNNGELVTQNYNTVLTLKKLYDTADACFLFHNQQLQSLIDKVYKLPKVDFQDLNKIIAQKLAGVFQPAGNNSLWNIVDHVVPHPSYKFALIKYSPYQSKSNQRYESTVKWPDLALHAKQMLRSSYDWEIKYASTKFGNDFVKSLCNLIVTRGQCDGVSFEALENNSFYSSWVPSESRLKHWHQNRSLNGESRSMTLVTNNSSIYAGIEQVLTQAWLMFSYSACVHQYAKYGLEKTMLEEAFIKVENIIKNYKSLENR